MKKILSFIFIMVLSLFMVSCNKKDYYEYNNLRFGMNKYQKVDLYLPKCDGEETSIIFFIHGGAWAAGDEDSYHSEMIKYMEKYNVACASISYRLIKKDYSITCEDILSDIDSAIDKVVKKASKKDITFKSMALTGASAGGHLALLYGYKYNGETSLPISLIFSYCGPTDLTDNNFYIGNNDLTKDKAYELMGQLIGEEINDDNLNTVDIQNKLLDVSPINYVTSSCPVTLLGHGMMDTVVPYTNATELDALLSENNVEHYLYSLPNSNHGMDQDPDVLEDYNEKLDTLIKMYLK